jgi:hypothetical protein
MKLFLIMLGMMVLIMGVAVTVDSNINNYYTGKITFNTEQEYSQFKTVLSDKDVTYQPEQISVLSSEPPIIVSFKDIKAASKYEFDYGERNNGRMISGCILMGVGIIFIIVVLVIGRKEKLLE